MGFMDDLNSGGGKSFKFDRPGDSVTGVVKSAEIRQRTNYDTGELETWQDGKPVNQYVIELATDLRDAQEPTDDGVRTVYVKAWGDQKADLRRAVRAAGVDDLDGSVLTMTYTGDQPPARGQRGFPTKLYSFKIEAPQSGAMQSLFSDDDNPPY